MKPELNQTKAIYPPKAPKPMVCVTTTDGSSSVVPTKNKILRILSSSYTRRRRQYFYNGDLYRCKEPSLFYCTWETSPNILNSHMDNLVN